MAENEVYNFNKLSISNESSNNTESKFFNNLLVLKI